MGWKATGQPTVRRRRDKWVVRLDGIGTESGLHRPGRTSTADGPVSASRRPHASRLPALANSLRGDGQPDSALQEWGEPDSLRLRWVLEGASCVDITEPTDGRELEQALRVRLRLSGQLRDLR
jgi:hypothetical protein